MLESSRVSIERGAAQTQVFAGLAPAGNGIENLAENLLRLGGLEAETLCGSKRDGNRRLFLLLGDCGLAHANSVQLRDWIEIVSRRQRPTARMEHQEAVIA